MKNLKHIIVVLSIITFITLLILVIKFDKLALDTSVYNIFKNIKNSNITIILKIITFLGSTIGLIIFTILLIFFIKDKRLKRFIPINVIIVSLLNNIIKIIIKRPRPSYRMVEEWGYSFPSGHSMISFAFYGFLIYLIYKNIENKKVKCFLIILLSVIILLIGISRIYLGVHYPSDVLAGFSLSYVYLVIIIKIYEEVVIK